MKTPLIALVLVATAAFASAAAVYDVRAFGAKGDGVAKDTAAVQAAIDAAAAAGGGEVLLPAGTYLSGAIYLKDNIDFHLGPGAVLKGSPDRADYSDPKISPLNNRPWAGESSSSAHFIVCLERTNVTVRGPGRIDGNAAAFALAPDGAAYQQNAIPWRPSQMLWFAQCRDVRVTDLEICNSTYWSCFFHGCDRVWVRGCRVWNNRYDRGTFHTHNGDGFDVDCCRWVSISDCDIDTGDDCITLRAAPTGPMRNRDCGWVTVTNCRLSTPCNAVRLGVGTGLIHDAVFSNLTVHDTMIAFNIVSAYGPKSRGCDFENIRFENCTVDCARFLQLFHRYAKDTKIANISFSGITGRSRTSGQILAHANRPFGRILFRDVDLDCGVIVENAPAVSFEGGFLKPRAASAAERSADDLKMGLARPPISGSVQLTLPGSRGMAHPRVRDDVAKREQFIRFSLSAMRTVEVDRIAAEEEVKIESSTCTTELRRAEDCILADVKTPGSFLLTFGNKSRPPLRVFADAVRPDGNK